MLAYNTKTHTHIVDPHYLSIMAIKNVWDHDKSAGNKIATAQLMWMYYMYNPHSPYRDYRNLTKSSDIIKAIFPKDYVDKRLAEIKKAIESLPIDEDADEESEAVRVNRLLYDPSEDAYMDDAIAFYKEHLRQTPLWDAYSSYKEAMYNLSKIIRDPSSSAQQIRTASQELDAIPLKMDRMRQQAEKDEAMTVKVSGDKTIKRSERLVHERKTTAIRKEVKIN